MLNVGLDVEELAGALKINAILDQLSDKEWHGIDELVSETNVEKDSLLKVVNFFRDFKFIEISVGGEKIKLDKDYINL